MVGRKKVALRLSWFICVHTVALPTPQVNRLLLAPPTCVPSCQLKKHKLALSTSVMQMFLRMAGRRWAYRPSEPDDTKDVNEFICHRIDSGRRLLHLFDFIERTNRGDIGRRPHWSLSRPSLCGAYLTFHRQKDSAVTLPSRPTSRMVCTHVYIAFHTCVDRHVREPSSRDCAKIRTPVPNATWLRHYQLIHKGDQCCMRK